MKLGAKLAVPAALVFALVAAPAFAGDHPAVTMSADEAHAHATAKHEVVKGAHDAGVELHSALKRVCAVAEAAHEHATEAACKAEMKGHTAAVAKHAADQAKHDMKGAHHGLTHGVKGHELPAHHPK